MSGNKEYASWHRSFAQILNTRPHAVAMVRGGEMYPEVLGIVRFYQTDKGVLVAIEVTGLPNPQSICGNSIFAIHIHGGDTCQGNATDSFAKAMGHYNPENCPHPNHVGDLPPLFANKGYAFSVLLTDRFTVDEIVGKTVIIHTKPDDFKSQPAGDSGEKMACGVIHRSFRKP